MSDKYPIVGIDGGTTGAIATIAFPARAPEAIIQVVDIPTILAGKGGGTVKKAVNAQAVWEELIKIEQAHGKIQLAVLEMAQAFPKINASVNFSMGETFGVLRAVLACMEIPHIVIKASVWKKHFRLTRDKEMVRAEAMKRHPSVAASLSRKKDHNRAEAIFLAEYGACQTGRCTEL